MRSALIGCPDCQWTSGEWDRIEGYCNRAHTAWIIHYMDQHAPDPIKFEEPE